MRVILAGMAALVVGVAAMAATGSVAEARTHKARVHAPRIRAIRPHKIRAPRNTYKTVRVRRADGTMMTGYRDSSGTHLRGPDGRTVNCQREIGAAEIDVACH